MLDRIEVRDFQSLRSADIPLGRLTVVTGPTGSGKSAVFRAVQLLARNARGTGYISHGRKTCSVTAGNKRWIVRLTRSSVRGGKNEYRVAQLVPTPVKDGEGWTAGTYTKLNGQVPARVTEMLRLSDLNFARQHDAPYLLSLPGAEIARRLGDLTNVSLVLGAAAEAGRVRKQAGRELDAARARREALMEEAQQFAGIRARRAAIAGAEEALVTASATEARVVRLRVLTGRLEAAEAAAAGARAEASRQAPPSLEALEGLAARADRLRELTADLEAEQDAAACFTEQARQAAVDERTAEQALHAALADVGQCPVCGQAVTV